MTIVNSLLILADGRRVNLRVAIDPETYAELEATQGLAMSLSLG
jgi:hypothetical protein